MLQMSKVNSFYRGRSVRQYDYFVRHADGFGNVVRHQQSGLFFLFDDVVDVVSHLKPRLKV